jgi:hypothetical protein
MFFKSSAAATPHAIDRNACRHGSEQARSHAEAHIKHAPAAEFAGRTLDQPPIQITLRPDQFRDVAGFAQSQLTLSPTIFRKLDGQDHKRILCTQGWNPPIQHARGFAPLPKAVEIQSDRENIRGDIPVQIDPNCL